MKINIAHLNKAQLLAELYNNAKAQGMGWLHFDPTPMTTEDAEALLEEHTYFDYVNGRVLKVDLSTNELDPWLYDRDNGEGAAAKIVASLENQ